MAEIEWSVTLFLATLLSVKKKRDEKLSSLVSRLSSLVSRLSSLVYKYPSFTSHSRTFTQST